MLSHTVGTLGVSGWRGIDPISRDAKEIWVCVLNLRPLSQMEATCRRRHLHYLPWLKSRGAVVLDALSSNAKVS